MDAIVALIEQIKTDFKLGKLKIPSLPEVAFKIRAAIHDENKSAFQIAKVIQLDPVLTSRLLHVVNSPLYRSDKEVTECHYAISRLGLRASRNLISSFIVQQVFGARNSLVRKALKQNWRHSAKVAAIAYILGRLTPGVQPDTALLSGLVHDIGVLPILRYAEEKPEVLKDKSRFFAMISKTSVRLGVAVLKAWGMDPQIVQIPAQINNFNYAARQAANTTDVVIIAHCLYEFSTGVYPSLDFLNDVASYAKLPISYFGVDASLELLENAQQEIGDIISLVTA